MADTSGRQPRRWTLIASAGLVGLLVVGAAFVALTGPGDGGGEAATTPTSAPTTHSPRPSGSGTGDTGCDVTDESKKIPTSAPTDVTWTLWKGAALPRSESAGPLEADDETGITGCYAHTPLGALMALVNIDYRMLLTAPDTKIVDEQVAKGPYKAEYKDYIAEQQPPENIAQVAGFRFVSYTGGSATIKLAIGEEDGGLAAVESTVVWRDHTWKDVASADDTDPDSAQRLDDLTGYVRFKGVG